MKVFSFAIIAAAGASASASAVASLRGSNEQMKRDLKTNDISVDVNRPDQAEAPIDVDFDFNAGGNNEVGGGNSANGGVGYRFNGAGGGGGGSCPACGDIARCCTSCTSFCDLLNNCSFTCA
jgi:hypothetical protein